MRVEHIDDLREVCERTGQPVDLVDDDDLKRLQLGRPMSTAMRTMRWKSTRFVMRQPSSIASFPLRQRRPAGGDPGALLRPPSDDALQEWIVSPRVNRSGVGDDDATLIEPASVTA